MLMSVTEHTISARVGSSPQRNFFPAIPLSIIMICFFKFLSASLNSSDETDEVPKIPFSIV